MRVLEVIMNKLFALINWLVVWSPSHLPILWSATVWSGHFRGRRSGRAYQIPVTFVRDGADIFYV